MKHWTGMWKWEDYGNAHHLTLSAATMLRYWPFFSASSSFYHPPCCNHHPEHCTCSHCILLSNFRTAGISITSCTCSITQSKTYIIPIPPHALSHLASPRHSMCVWLLHFTIKHILFSYRMNAPVTHPTPDPHKCDTHPPSVSLLHCHLHFIIFI